MDCVWLDREHVASDLSVIGNQIRAAKIHDVDALVRVPRGSYSDLIHPLEMDAAGIMVPHVIGLEDARRVAWQTRFHPIGHRPIDGGNADGAYCMVSPDDYVRQANEQWFVIVQIEAPEPMDELDEIAQVEGIDMLFFGPADFSHGIGTLGDMAHPRVVDAKRRIAETARCHGKFAGTVASPETLAETLALGYQFVSVAADVIALSNTFRQASEAFAKIGA